MSVIQFEWDENKNQQNILKHGISFEQAKEIFATRYITIPAKSEHEERIIAVGKYQGILYVAVVYTPRKEKIRIISARRAKAKEIETHTAITQIIT
jgi:uncharacterized protein